MSHFTRIKIQIKDGNLLLQTLKLQIEAEEVMEDGTVRGVLGRWV